MKWRREKERHRKLNWVSINEDTYLSHVTTPNPLSQADIDNEDLAHNLHEAGESFLTQCSGQPLPVDCEAFILLSQSSRFSPLGYG